MAFVDDEKIAIELAKGKSDIKAYQAVKGCSYEVANSNASTWMKTHPQVKARAIELVQTTLGMTLPEVLDVVKAGTQAYYENKAGKQLPDFTNRLEAAKTLLRLHNELKEGIDINIDNSQHLHMSKEDMRDLASIVNELKNAKGSTIDIKDYEVLPRSASSEGNGAYGGGVG